MQRDTLKFPWNPVAPVRVSATEYERQIVNWLNTADTGLSSFRVVQPVDQAMTSDEYAFAACAEFQTVSDAKTLVLIECIRHDNPVRRETVMALEEKRRDLGAHKAMLFSTAGFQRDALEYAAQRRLATIVFIDSKLTYEAIGRGPVEYPPDMPKFSGLFVSVSGSSGRADVVSDEYPQLFKEWVLG